MNRIPIINTNVDNLSMNEAVNEICKLAKGKTSKYVVTPNIDHIVLIETDSEFRHAYEKASLRLVDGQPLVWLAKLRRTPIKEKVSGSDLFGKVCEVAATKQLTIFILGGMPGVADKAAVNLKKSYPGLQVAGTYSPKLDFEKRSKDVLDVVATIKKANPNILFVCLGSPKSEKFLYNNRNLMNVPVSLSVGAAVDFTAGTVKRAPSWISKLGLEWIFRVIKEPRRLARRYFKDLFQILPLIFKYW